MTLFVTYCSAEKATEETDLPAVERYRSDRISDVFLAAKIAGVDFRILSGEFGLLAATTPIPYYDHLLTDAEVGNHGKKVARQLADLQPTQVVFFSRQVAADPNVAPYRSVMLAACTAVGVNCAIVELPDRGQSAESLVKLVAEFLD